LAQRAASHPACSLIVHDTLDILSKKIKEEINGCTTPTVDQVTVPTNVTPVSNLVSTARLKKKDVETKTSKRKRTWLDKKCKFTKKGTKKKEKGSMVCTTTKYITFSVDCSCINGKLLSYSSIIRRNNKLLKWRSMMV
jgi:hypothetical protein